MSEKEYDQTYNGAVAEHDGTSEPDDDRSAAQEYIRGHYSNIKGLDDVAGGIQRL